MKFIYREETGISVPSCCSGCWFGTILSLSESPSEGKAQHFFGKMEIHPTVQCHGTSGKCQPNSQSERTNFDLGCIMLREEAFTIMFYSIFSSWKLSRILPRITLWLSSSILLHAGSVPLKSLVAQSLPSSGIGPSCSRLLAIKKLVSFQFNAHSGTSSSLCCPQLELDLDKSVNLSIFFSFILFPRQYTKILYYIE